MPSEGAVGDMEMVGAVGGSASQAVNKATFPALAPPSSFTYAPIKTSSTPSPLKSPAEETKRPPASLVFSPTKN